MELRKLKKGEWFTKKDIAEPTESQVWVRGDYDRFTKSFVCTRFDDISKSMLVKANKTVYTDFIF